MKYCEFLDCIQNQTKSTAGKGGKVTVNHMIKNNGRELDGLVIMEENSHISPTIYLNDYYEQYINGRRLDSIVNEIITIYKENKNKISINTGLFNDFNSIKDMIVYRLVNYQQNKKLLESVPHKKFLDLAVIFYCLLEQQCDGNATALIYNSHMEMWGISECDIFKAAVKNTPRLLKSDIRPMSELIRRMMPLGIQDEDMLEYCEDSSCLDDQMYVLTNESKIHGAACILYEDVLRDFSNKLGRDLYILPSSIHEVILLPKTETFNIDCLNSMIHEVNCDGVSDDEILSDHVYKYNRVSGMIEM